MAISSQEPSSRNVARQPFEGLGFEELNRQSYALLNRLLASRVPNPDRPPSLLHIGEPKLGPPDAVRTVMADAWTEFGTYPGIDGSPDTRRAVQKWLERRYHLAHPPDLSQLLIIPGTREALVELGAVASRVGRARGKGDAPVVLVPDPFYNAWLGAALAHGCEPVPVPCRPETHYQPAYFDIPESIWRRTCLVFVNSPSNPTGWVASRAFLEKLWEKCRAHDAFLASDECYSEFWHDTQPGTQPGTGPQPPTGLFEIDPSLQGAFVFNSLSKRSSVPGLRMGFMAGAPDALELVRIIRRIGGGQCPLPLQRAGAALWNDETHVEKARQFYRDLVELADSIFSTYPGYHRPEGGFFLWLRVENDLDFVCQAWERYHIKLLPGRYTSLRPDEVEPHVRIALVDPPDRLVEPLRRIRGLLEAQNTARPGRHPGRPSRPDAGVATDTTDATNAAPGGSRGSGTTPL